MTETLKRQYRPAVGQLVKLREWSHYTALNLSPWGYMRVAGLGEDVISARHAPSPLDPTKDEGYWAIDYTRIAPPIGWAPTYTICCSPEQARTIVDDWFKRGIRVAVSHDMSSRRGDMFTPADVEGVDSKPHWAYENADVVSPEDCPQVFKVVAYVEHAFHMPKDKAARALARMAHTRHDWTMEYIKHGGGFWIRRKEVTIWDHPFGFTTSAADFTPPYTGRDLLDLTRNQTPRRPDESERAARGEPCPDWILMRAGMHLDGEVQGAGNSTWMFDPEAPGDPVRRKTGGSNA